MGAIASTVYDTPGRRLVPGVRDLARYRSIPTESSMNA